MTINAKTHLYGILGNPVEHSLSPLLHNTLFQKYKLNAVYMAFPVDKNSLGLAFEALRALGMRGANITIPFKEEATQYIDEIPDDVDRCVGAINTVVNREGKLYGYNTDGTGFLMALKEELNFNPEGKKIVVFGAGGAARGVVYALARARAESIRVHNRSRERAEGLCEYVSTHFPNLDIKVIENQEAVASEKPNLVVNATSLGMASSELPFDLRFLKQSASVYDLVYTPAETPFLKQARSLKLPCANGLGMLAAQAALSFELWTGKKEGVREAMVLALKKCITA
ncbi:MAG: shikimate dehydrogenase [Candidatus Omnitrophica bacterium CG1_02_46_14]|nr:MAG: shikimate dehydrogenase [Candidatus Omnitrophica bacterium CG1_02_46_14]